MTSNETDLTAAADRLAQRDVILCLSGMVATLASAWGVDHVNDSMNELHEQAQELCSPVLDYEEGALEAGWQRSGSVWTHDDYEDAEVSAEAACHASGSDPYEWEVFEHWAVSPWLAEKLAAEGERVDTDFAGLNVWGRTTTGQSISMDAVIRKIAADLLKAA